MGSYSRDELKSVVQHERTHIRLGHLWLGLAWDVLRCLLWVNPFLTVCQKQFRADMEDICDRVCIQSSGRTAHEYGMVLLKTLKLLSSKSEGTPPAVTYAGEREFAYEKTYGRDCRFPSISEKAVHVHGSSSGSSNRYRITHYT